MNARESQMLMMLEEVTGGLERCLTGGPLRGYELDDFLEIVRRAEKMIKKMHKKRLEDAGVHK